MGLVRDSALVFEREHQLARLEQGLDAAAAGRGAAVAIEAAAGMGKSTLLDVARSQAGERGMAVAHVRGSELLQSSPWAGVVSLVESALAGVSEARREAILSGAGRPALRLLDEAAPEAEAAPAGDPVFPVVHGLFWVLSSVAERGGALVALDDAHWLDALSLRFVLYLLDRLEELPLTLVVAVRSGEPTPVRGLLERVATHPRCDALGLEALSPAAVAAVVRGELGEDVADAHCDRCAELTAGNPFYLRQLLLTLAPGGLDGAALRSAAPRGVARAVLIRIGRLSRAAGRLAESVALLGDGVALRHAAAHAGLDENDAASAADELAAAEILERSLPPAFAHPLVAAAIYADIPAAARASGHSRAASLLAREGVALERVVPHLLATPPGADPSVVARLREVAGRDAAHGDPDSAARLLQRALAEPPPAELVAPTLLELGRAQLAAGLPGGIESFERALDLAREPGMRAQAGHDLARALFMAGRSREAAATLERGIAELGEEGGELAKELRAAFVGMASFDARTRPDALAAVEEILARPPGETTPGERALLAQLGFQRALDSESPARVRELCDRAWDGGRLLADESCDGINWTLTTAALFIVDELERELELLEDVFADVRRRNSPLAFASASLGHAFAMLGTGEITRALADVEAVSAAREYGWGQHVGVLARVHARCLVERGELDAAARALGPLDAPELADSSEYPLMLEVRGRVQLAGGRPREALDDFQTAGGLLGETFSAPGPALLAWRSSAALAAHALGDRSRALELAEEELALVARGSGRRSHARALRVRGLVEGGESGLRLLQDAVDVFDGAGPRLERVAALVELGAALRRANRRADARPPLRRALELARAGGATVLAGRAHDELTATGTRVRRGPETGDELTPSERRIAEMAAEGLTNPEIAQALFVTAKTVEWHLGHVYRKLGIDRRQRLAGALAAE